MRSPGQSSRPVLPLMPSGSSELVNTHRHVPTPIKIPRTHVHAPSVTIERTPAARSPSPSPSGSVATTNHSAQPTLASTSNSTPTTSSSAVSPQPSPDPSMLSDSAPEFVTVLRAERASAAMLGLGFGLTLRPSDSAEHHYNASGFARQDSATLPREGPYMSRASVVNGRLSPAPGATGLSPIPGSSSTGPSMSAGLAEGSPLAPSASGAAALSPAPPSSAVASAPVSSAGKGKSPALRRSISTDEGLAKSSRSGNTYARPETIYAPQSGIHRISEIPSTPHTPGSELRPQESPVSASPRRSPTRHRSKTLASPGEERRSPSLASGRELTGREMYVNLGRESPLTGSRQRALTVDANPRAHQPSGSGIRRSRSPSGATTATTHPSRPITPPDAHPFPVQRVPKAGAGNMSTQAQVADLAIQTGVLVESVQAPVIPAPAPSPTSPTCLAYLESPAPPSVQPVRTMRLQSAPQMSSMGVSASPVSVPAPNLPPAPVPVGSSAPGPGPATLLSKFARSQMSFENFSFLGSRSRSVSDTTVAPPPMQRERGWTVGTSPLSPIAADGEASPSASSGASPSVPVRPARRPSLTLRDDPPIVAVGSSVVVDAHDYRPRLAHSNSGSSTGSGFALGRAGSTSARGSGARLRRKRSSPRQGGTKVLPDARDRSGSESAINSSAGHYRTRSTNAPGLQRTGSTAGSSGSHRTAGTQQPTPTSTGSSPTPATPALALKQRRETMFPSTPRSFSHESTLDSPGISGGRGGPVPDFPGFVLDGSLLMPLKSPAPPPSGSATVAGPSGGSGGARKAHLPIGPKLSAPTLTRSETLPVVTSAALPAHTPAPASSAVPKSTSRSQSKQQQQQQQVQQPQPPSPTFEPVPVRWRGFTMDAAKWTFSSNQLQNIVSRAIKQSAETSSVRLLSLDVLDQELPVEVERLEQLRDVLQTKYKAQVRRRRLLMRSLAL